MLQHERASRAEPSDRDGSEPAGVITRREAIQRVSALLGGLTLVGGTALLSACERERSTVGAAAPIGEFTLDDIALLDEIADTILPETKTPGAKAAKTGAFMALMVTDTYKPEDQKIFRDGMRALDDASRKANGVAFVQASPQQRLSLLETLDREQKAHSDAREAARKARAKADTTKTADPPTHYFRMMKELALLGYFTSEIGSTQVLRYIESPGRFDPCVPYTAGERAWAPHA